MHGTGFACAEDGKAEATLELTQTSFAFLIGYTSLALSLVQATASGEVFNLSKLEDFNGMYMSASVEGTLRGRSRGRDHAERKGRGHPSVHDHSGAQSQDSPGGHEAQPQMTRGVAMHTTATHTTMKTCLLLALALTPLGCATRQQLLEMDTEFKARMSKMEMGLATEKRRVDELNVQLEAVRATAMEATRIGNEATRIGTDARQRADVAAAKGEAVDGRVTSALANRLNRTQVQEFRVGFDTGRADLPRPAEQALQGAAKLLAENPTYTVDIVGHTDDVGASGSNVNLSWRRSEVVRRFMVTRGVALNRFSFIGFGEDRAKETTEAGRARDRYVNVRVFRPVE